MVRVRIRVKVRGAYRCSGNRCSDNRYSDNRAVDLDLTRNVGQCPTVAAASRRIYKCLE